MDKKVWNLLVQFDTKQTRGYHHQRSNGGFKIGFNWLKYLN